MKQSLQNLKTIDVSVIIVSFNTRKLTLGCINSVIDSTEGITYEIVVIDNLSKDGSVDDILRLKKKKSEIRIKFFANKENLGFAKAVNQGISNSVGKYILLLNSDTVIPKGAIKKLLDFTDKKSDAGVVGTKLLNADGSVQASCFHFPTIKRAILQYFFGKKNYFEKYAPDTKNYTAVESVVGAVFLITPNALNKVGLLNDRYFMYFEDLDYCRRVKKAGLKVYYYPLVAIKHLHGASGKSIATESNQWRRLIPSSKVYHGLIGHYLLTIVLWLGQKFQKLFKK